MSYRLRNSSRDATRCPPARVVPILPVLAILLAGPGESQTGEPEGNRLEELVRELGARDFDAREAATEALRRLGEAALPRLRRAHDDPDPEIRWRARRLVQGIEAAAAGRQPRPPAPVPARVVQRLRVGVRAVGGERTFELEEDGRTWRFVRKADGTIEGVRPGESGEPEAFSYQSEEEMRTSDPELHRKMSGDLGGVRVVIGGAAPARSDYLGIVPGEIRPELRERLGLEPGAGVLVQEVVEGSPARRAGLAAGDVVLEAAGRGVGDLEALRRSGEGLQPGEPLRLLVIRDGERREVVIR